MEAVCLTDGEDVEMIMPYNDRDFPPVDWPFAPPQQHQMFRKKRKNRSLPV